MLCRAPAMNVSISGELLESLLSFAADRHPREVIVLLRGKRADDEFEITEFLLPPYATGGMSFAQFPAHMLPIDFTIVGTAHSHPSGTARPSVADLNNFYSRVMIIVAFPYRRGDVAAYNARGEPQALHVHD